MTDDVLVISEPPDVIVITEPEIQIVEVLSPGIQGPPGPQGPTGGLGPPGPAVAGQLFLSAAGIWPSATDGAAPNAKIESPTHRVNTYVVDFADGLVPLYAEATVVMPSDWDGGPVDAVFYWTTDSAALDAVVWGLQGRSFGEGETFDQAWGLPQTVVDETTGTPREVLRSPVTAPMSLGGTPAPGELAQFRVFRDPADTDDTLAGAARLLGVMIAFTRQ